MVSIRRALCLSGIRASCFSILRCSFKAYFINQKPLVKLYQPPGPQSWGKVGDLGDTPKSPGRRILLHLFFVIPAEAGIQKGRLFSRDPLVAEALENLFSIHCRLAVFKIFGDGGAAIQYVFQ